MTAESDNRRVVVVTGASTGIGAACVETLTKAGFFVFGSVRRAVDADRIRTRYGHRAAPLLFDVTDDAAVEAAALVVADHLQGATLAGLVNNAGIAVPGPLIHLQMADFRRQIATNLTAQLKIIQVFAPLLGARPGPVEGAPGRIVNMSSVAGRFAAPFLGAYNASKFGLEGLSDALRRELTVFGVDVILIEPGMIATPIWDKADNADFSAFGETIYAAPARRVQKWLVEQGRSAAPADRVADATLRALTARRPPVRIAVVANPLLDYFLPPLLPARFADWLVARRLGFADLRKKIRL
jgi:NAD(P)-dependent dehydrogenase (short-subunit alcohol dehydrogenase family)